MTEGENLRNEGIQRVLDNEDNVYKEEYRRRALSQEGEFLFEDIRLAMELDGYYPKHTNSCGGVSCDLVRKKLVVEVGERRKSLDPRSHARKQPVYKVNRRRVLTLEVG